MAREFMPIQKFLALRDPYDGRAYTDHWTAEQWLRRYEVAKRSFEAHGAGGPPEGTVIITLRAGFGGLGLNRRVLGGIHSDKRCLIVLMPTKQEGVCLASRAHWWREFYAEEQHEEGLHDRTGDV